MSELESNKQAIADRKKEDLTYLGELHDKLKAMQHLKLNFGRYINVLFKDSKIIFREPPRYANSTNFRDVACVRVVNKEILLTSCHFPNKQIKKFATLPLLEKELIEIFKRVQ